MLVVVLEDAAAHVFQTLAVWARADVLGPAVAVFGFLVEIPDRLVLGAEHVDGLEAAQGFGRVVAHARAVHVADDQAAGVAGEGAVKAGPHKVARRQGLDHVALAGHGRPADLEARVR